MEAMARLILSEERLHPAIRDRVQNHYRALIEEVDQATAVHNIVIVGMKQNPFPRRACALLDQKGLAYKYFEFGSYLGGWRQRNAFKMWTGWPTMPIIFVGGVMIGGYDDLKRLVDTGSLA